MNEWKKWMKELMLLGWGWMNEYMNNVGINMNTEWMNTCYGCRYNC